MKKNKEKAGAYIRVSGMVQGVAYRHYAREVAEQLGIKGCIKNLINGDVELIVEGSQKAVKQMIEWCKEGPRLAIVENIEVDWLPYSGEFNQFHIK